MAVLQAWRIVKQCSVILLADSNLLDNATERRGDDMQYDLGVRGLQSDNAYRAALIQQGYSEQAADRLTRSDERRQEKIKAATSFETYDSNGNPVGYAENPGRGHK